MLRRTALAGAAGAGRRASTAGAVGTSGAGKALGEAKAKEMSRAMAAYLEEARKRETFMAKETAEFQLGKRHLANMMSMEVESMTQEDVDAAVEYLFPSALLEPRARPLLKPPERLWPQQKKPQFGMDGRPHHTFFYTLTPNFYQVLSDVAELVEKLRKMEMQDPKTGTFAPLPPKVETKGTEWISKDDLLKRTMEPLGDAEYEQLLAALELLLSLPYAGEEAKWIAGWRKPLSGAEAVEDFPVPPVRKCEETGREFVEAPGSRKNCRARVRLFLRGTGALSLNGIPLAEIPHMQNREQLLAPFLLLDRLGEADVEAETWQPQSDDKSCEWHLLHSQPFHGLSAKCGAVRLGIARCLTAVASPAEREKLRLAGLLTPDPRTNLRHRPGQKGAKAKWIWQKR